MGRLIDADELLDWIQNCWDWATVDGITSTTVLKQTMTDISQLTIVEAIPKDQYEARLKADLKAILVELQMEIHELENPYPHDYDNLLPLAQHNAFYDAKSTIEDLVDEKINALKEKR